MTSVTITSRYHTWSNWGYAIVVTHAGSNGVTTSHNNIQFINCFYTRFQNTDWNPADHKLSTHTTQHDDRQNEHRLAFGQQTKEIYMCVSDCFWFHSLLNRVNHVPRLHNAWSVFILWGGPIQYIWYLMIIHLFVPFGPAETWLSFMWNYMAY